MVENHLNQASLRYKKINYCVVPGPQDPFFICKKIKIKNLGQNKYMSLTFFFIDNKKYIN